MTRAFEILGLAPTASRGEAKKAYYQLCLIHHPDKTGSHSTANMQTINAAYEEIVAIFDRHDEVWKPISGNNASTATTPQSPAPDEKHQPSRPWGQRQRQKSARTCARCHFFNVLSPQREEEELQLKMELLRHGRQLQYTGEADGWYDAYRAWMDHQWKTDELKEMSREIDHDDECTGGPSTGRAW